mmetsp:Transcript_38380/g.93204  ORF Transcript_38380/g.93204 Transcript_38380/m.93204 type:complete len:664 (+) Transcript_38380:213-2204(+)|eukprot:CAMPEP_0113464006 /NCGR_PEP_ID=MMETSP0014_2-20120614/12966_1 /TAXON_ID=2857 /ORGANISM="Nitzschia sp." /LENGTH=663 /DNA_ID=CAMNT_0000356049 /DNA_START=160 /DNA_END=2151 /DNA_ORIENTATION=+ /assembly_acc=CAM_ASM_000159
MAWTATARSSTTTRRGCSSSSWCRKYGSIIILLTVYFGGQVLKLKTTHTQQKASLQLGNLLLLLSAAGGGDSQQKSHRGGIGILPPLSENTTTTTPPPATASTAAAAEAVGGTIYWCGNSPNSKALRYMFPEYEFDSSERPWKWSPPNTNTTTLQLEAAEEEDAGNVDGNVAVTTTPNILIMSMYQSVEQCDTRQALARFLLNDSHHRNNSNSNYNNNKILFVNGESVGNVFDWSAIENGYFYLDDAAGDKQQQEEVENKEAYVSDNATTAGKGRSPTKKKRTTKVVISDVSQHVYQIGPVAGRSGLKDDSTITITSTTGSTTASTQPSSSQSSSSSPSLTVRNSHQVFLFTIDLLSRMVHELEVELELEMGMKPSADSINNKNDNNITNNPQPILQFEHRLPTTKTWKALTSPSHRPRRNTGLHNNNNNNNNAVAYFHNNCRPHRQEAARSISSVLPVHFGSDGCTVVENPRFPNNTVRVVETNDGDQDDETDDTNNITSRRRRRRRRRNRRKRFLAARDRWGSRNSQLFSKYKYCLVMENRLGVEGYMTEKLLNALLAGCLPIYAGLPRHQFYDIFNPHAMIYWDVKEPHRSLNLLKELESNSTKYEEMVRAPILQPHAVHKYFSITPSLVGGDGDGSLNHRIRRMMGLPPYPYPDGTTSG